MNEEKIVVEYGVLNRGQCGQINGSETTTNEKMSGSLKRGSRLSLCCRLFTMALLLGATYSTRSELTPSGMSLAMFQSGRVQETTVFRVKIKVASDWYGWSEFRMRDKFWAVYIRPFLSRDDAGVADFVCYVNKESEEGKVVSESLKDGNYHAAMVALRYSDGGYCDLVDIEMLASVEESDVSARFSSTRISLSKIRDNQYVQGKIGLSIKTKLKYLKKPIVRVVLLLEENGARVIRDSIMDEPDIKMLNASDSIEHYTTTHGDENNEPYSYYRRRYVEEIAAAQNEVAIVNKYYRRRYIEEIAAAQNEVAADKYRNISYVGVPLGSHWRKSIKGGTKVHDFGYARFDKDEQIKLLGYRIEVWYNGACISTYDTIKDTQLKRLQIPADWHISFKHPEKFKYRAPLSRKYVVRQ